MATFKGDLITSFEAGDIVDSRVHGGIVKSYRDAFELSDTADADFAIVLKISVDAIIDSVIFASDDLGTAGTVDIGFYKADGDSYTVVDADAIANGVDVNSAAVTPTDYRYSVKAIDTAGQAAWELAGLSARPEYSDFYIGLTTDTGTTAAGTVLLEVKTVE